MWQDIIKSTKNKTSLNLCISYIIDDPKKNGCTPL